MADHNALPLIVLAEKFASLPGIGMKTAHKLAYYVMSMKTSDVESFAEALINAKKNVHKCKCCMNLTEREICPICASDTRDKSIICVVETPKDVTAFERTREYHGVYHVLHGAISPMLGIGPGDIKLKELIKRLEGDVKEVIIATNSSLEGETTAMYISKLIKPTGVKVTRIASGVPVGGDLECIDEMTLLRALEGRVEL